MTLIRQTVTTQAGWSLLTSDQLTQLTIDRQPVRQMDDDDDDDDDDDSGTTSVEVDLQWNCRYVVVFCHFDVKVKLSCDRFHR